MRSIFLVLGLASSLNACVVSNVERFHNGFEVEAGKSFKIDATEQQRNSLVFRNVSDYLASKMADIGFVQANNYPDYNIIISFGEGDGYSVVSSSTDSKGETDVSSSVAYTRNFNLKIFDVAGAKRDRPDIVFEGVVRSSGKAKTFSKVRKCLIDALFKNFPGESGKSQKITMSEACVS